MQSSRSITPSRCATPPIRAVGETHLRLFRTKVWSAVDISLLKWCCFLFGMIAGAYLADFTKRHLWFIAIAAVLLGIRPSIHYFRDDGPDVPPKN